MEAGIYTSHGGYPRECKTPRASTLEEPPRWKIRGDSVSVDGAATESIRILRCVQQYLMTPPPLKVFAVASPNDYIEVNPRKCGGVPVFRDTRIPVWILFDYLEGHGGLQGFEDAYGEQVDMEIVRGFLHALGERYRNEGEVAA